MILLIIFAFIAGIVTVLSPCILPLLPIILSSSSDHSGKQKPLGVVVGFVISFTFFTLFLSSIVRLTGISADALRVFSIAVLAIFGASLLIPQIQAYIEILFSRIANSVSPSSKQTGFIGGVIIGLSLGLLWTPCVGPILASVISLAITGTVTAQAFFITFAYSLGTAIPMLLIMMAGSTALKKVPWLVRNTAVIQKAFGVLMILTALAIYLNIDRKFQAWILETFPGYGVGLTRIEENRLIQDQLNRFSSGEQQSFFVTSDQLLTPKEDVQRAPELIPGGEWMNSIPLQLSELKGKVVLIDFWTYTCINCVRTFPYLNAWWQKYQSEGLVMIGVHSPEFEFEKNPANVQQSLADYQLQFPVMQDNNFETWRAYNNKYWPAKYLIDKDGFVRYVHFGEGEYDQTEQAIQTLLAETGADLSEFKIENPEYQILARTPEIYLGYDRIEGFASNETVQPDKASTYTFPSRIPLHEFAFEGEWHVRPEFASAGKGSSLILQFESKDVYVVARPTVPTSSFEVFLDGKKVEGGSITVDSDQLYQLIGLPEAGRHELRLDFPQGNIELFAFTFG